MKLFKCSHKMLNRSCAAALATATILLPGALRADMINPADFERSFTITFPGYSGTETLTDFPALVRLSAEKNDFRYSKCQDGESLRFADADGNLIPHEIDTWDASGESLVWVNVPSLNATTIITAYYGWKGEGYPPVNTPTDVWSNGFVGVWHLGESARPLRDSTATAIHFTSSYNSAEKPGYLDDVIGYAENGGAVGKAVRFGLTCGNSNKDGKGGLLADDPEGTLSGFSAMTLEIWAKPDSIVDTISRYLVSKRLVDEPKTTVFNFYYNQPNSSGAQNAVAYFGYDKDGTTSGYETINVSGGNMAVKDTGVWYYHVAQFDRTRAAYTNYLNGAYFGRQTGQKDYNLISTETTQDPLCLGNQPHPNTKNYFKGTLDELRISNVTRSEAWIKATYDTVKEDNFAFYSVANDWKKYSHTFFVSFPGATNGVLSAFPVLVKVSESAIPGFRYADCLKEDGGDLRFADENGNLLDSEVDTWGTNGVSLIWVNVPSLANNTAIKAYYGWKFAPYVDPMNVWTNGYVGVWHLGEDRRPLRDSTAMGLDFTSSYDESKPYYLDECNGYGEDGGAVGKAVRFGLPSSDSGKDGRGGLLAYDPEAKLGGFSAMSAEIWAKPNDWETMDTTTDKYLFSKRLQNNPKTPVFYTYYAKTSLRPYAYFGVDKNQDGTTGGFASYGTSSQTSMTNSPAGQWYYHAIRFDRTASSSITSFLNGAYHYGRSGQLDNDIIAYPDPLCLGNNPNANQKNVFLGCLDEFRISNVARSAAWIKTTYDTIANNANFTTYGSAKANKVGVVVYLK